MKAGQRRGVGGRQIERPERLVPRQDDREQHGRGDARHRHRREHVDDLVQERSSVHARRLEDVDRDLLEVGVEHPDQQRQIEQHQDDADAEQAVEQVQITEYQIDRHQHADRRHHLGRQHPHQEVLGALARRERHRPGRRNGDEETDHIGADRQHDRIVGEFQIVRALCTSA